MMREWWFWFSLGSVLTEALHRWLRWRGHRRHAHCELCNGCLDEVGQSLYALERLAICPECGDTMPPARLDEVSARWQQRELGRLRLPCTCGPGARCNRCAGLR